MWLVWKLKAMPISNLKTNALCLFILHPQSSEHVVTGYNSKLDSSFMRSALACIVILSNCMSASGFGHTDCGWGMSTHGETTPNMTLWVAFLQSSIFLPASPSLCLVSPDYLWSNLYVCSVLYVCVYVVSFRIKGYSNLKFKNQWAVFVHSSPTVEWTCSNWI